MRTYRKRRILGPAFSSYAGRVHIPNMPAKPECFSGRGIYINTVCAGHVIVDESDMFASDGHADRPACSS